MRVTANEGLVRQAIESIWNRGDLDVADELFAPDYVNHDGLIADLVLGPEAIKISVALYRLAFPDLHVTVEKLSTNEDRVVLRWTAWSGSTGGLEGSQGSALSANETVLRGITRSRVAGGKIMESWTEWDRVVTLLPSS